MFQFIGILIIVGIVVAYDKAKVAESRRYLETRYNEASVTGDRDAARWYAERLSRLK